MNDSYEDILIHRAASREAQPGDWQALRAMADSTPGVWRRLGLALQDQADLERDVDAFLERAEGVRLHGSGDLARRARLGPVAAWAGWAAALLLTWLWSAQGPVSDGSAAERQQAGLVLPVGSAQQALDAFREFGKRDGRLIEELPVLLLEQRSLPDGSGQELLYLRRLVERVRAPQVFTLAPDDSGSPVPVAHVPDRRRRSAPL